MRTKKKAEVSFWGSCRYFDLSFVNLSDLLSFQALVNFTDEEGYGRYLDLNEVYQKYINLKGIEASLRKLGDLEITGSDLVVFAQKIGYMKYLSQFDQLFSIPREKKNQDYVRYLEALYDYLYGYIEKAKPLLDVESELSSASKEFEKKWAEGSFQGWPVSLRLTFYRFLLAY